MAIRPTHALPFILLALCAKAGVMLAYRRSNMTIEQTLEKLAEARSQFKEVRAAIEVEVREFRHSRRVAYEANVARLVREAYALGASLADIKRAYGTKDHRTVSMIIDTGSAEIAAIRQATANAEATAATSWFTLDGDDFVTIERYDTTVVFKIIPLEGDEIMLSTESPRFNGEGEENPVVAHFDGYTSDEVADIETIRKEWAK